MAGIRRSGGLQAPGTGLGHVPSPAGQFRAGIPRPQLDRDSFDALMHLNGREVCWEKGMPCPNRRGPSPRDHDINCSFCGGAQFVYYDAVQTRMAISSMTVEENFQAYGRFDSGTIKVTPMSEFRLSFWDRITFCEGSIRFAELMRRGRDAVDYTKYELLELHHVAWVDRAGALVEATIDTDITIDAEGQLSWLTTTRPDPLDHYTIAYTCRPQFIVMDLPHIDRMWHITTVEGDKPYEFPVEAIARLNFFERKESEDPSDEDERQDPFRRDFPHRR